MGMSASCHDDAPFRFVSVRGLRRIFYIISYYLKKYNGRGMKKFQDENMGAKSEPGTARLYHITPQIARQSYFKERIRN
jgi:hypothetical protein